MKITLNNRPETFAENEMSIQELIKKKNFTFKLLVTKLNGQLVKKESRNEALVHEGDKVDVIHLISGG